MTDPREANAKPDEAPCDQCGGPLTWSHAGTFGDVGVCRNCGATLKVRKTPAAPPPAGDTPATSGTDPQAAPGGEQGPRQRRSARSTDPRAVAPSPNVRTRPV